MRKTNAKRQLWVGEVMEKMCSGRSKGLMMTGSLTKHGCFLPGLSLPNTGRNWRGGWTSPCSCWLCWKDAHYAHAETHLPARVHTNGETTRLRLNACQIVSQGCSGSRKPGGGFCLANCTSARVQLSYWQMNLGQVRCVCVYPCKTMHAFLSIYTRLFFS